MIFQNNFSTLASFALLVTYWCYGTNFPTLIKGGFAYNN